MQGKVYIKRVENGVRFVETENGKPIRHIFISDDDPTGNIYRGKVERVTGAGAFVDIGREKNGFLSDCSLRPGDYVTVTVSKGEDGEKGCVLTEKLSVAGRYAIVTDGEETRFSRKTAIPAERKKEIALSVGRGVIFRTAFSEETEHKALAEISELRGNLENIKKAAKNKFDIALLYETDPMTTAENMSDKERGDFSEIESLLEETKERKITVNGVELVFDTTEAMTVIDVNSHLNNSKFSDSEKYAAAANAIAVKEICRQIRLRNIGGTIAVDFISVKKAENIEKLKKNLAEELRKDDVMAKFDLSEKFCIALISRTKRYR